MTERPWKFYCYAIEGQVKENEQFGLANLEDILGCLSVIFPEGENHIPHTERAMAGENSPNE